MEILHVTNFLTFVTFREKAVTERWPAAEVTVFWSQNVTKVKTCILNLVAKEGKWLKVLDI